MSHLLCRPSSVNNKISSWAIKLGWFAMAVNTFTLCLYFWGAYPLHNLFQRAIYAAVMCGLILLVEFAAMSIMFDPDVLDKFLGQPSNASNDLGKIIAGATMIALCLIMALTFYYDYQINLAAFGKHPKFDYQIIAAVMVVIAELCFICASIVEAAMMGGGDEEVMVNVRAKKGGGNPY